MFKDLVISFNDWTSRLCSYRGRNDRVNHPASHLQRQLDVILLQLLSPTSFNGFATICQESGVIWSDSI